MRRVVPRTLLGALALASGCGRVGFDGNPDAAPVAPPTFRQIGESSADGMGQLSVPLPQPVALGDTLVIAVAYDTSDPNRGIATMTDTLGTTFTQLAPVDGAFGNRQILAVGRAPSAGTDRVAVTLAAASDSYFAVRALAYAGVDPTTAIDASAGNAGSITGTDGVRVDLATTTPNTTAVVVGIAIGGAIVASTGYATRSAFGGDLAADRALPDAGTVTLTATEDAGTWTFAALALRGN